MTQGRDVMTLVANSSQDNILVQPSFTSCYHGIWAWCKKFVSNSIPNKMIWIWHALVSFTIMIGQKLIKKYEAATK